MFFFCAYFIIKKMSSSLRKWLQVSIFNLMLIALIGVILRYKIAFSLPFIDQKYLLHGHSHFAFAGWITQALMALLVAYLSEKSGENYFKKYRWLLYANLVTAYGMLLTFPLQGYAFSSILFSTLSIFVSYVFAVNFLRDSRKIKDRNTGHGWFTIAILCNAVSSIGPFALSYMMATKNIQQNWYLASIYFFLHFQYNGWFFFACMGLLHYQLSKYGVTSYALKRVFILFAIALLPAFFLSVLWWPIPSWIYILVVIAAICQLAGWWLLIRLLQQQLSQIKKKLSTVSKYLFILCAIAFTIKLCLQAGSVIPSLSNLAFGFRPIVIGYLHLVLLGVISIFIISYTTTNKLITVNRPTITGFIIFTAGIFINELLLMIQGVAGLNYEGVPFIHVFLLASAIILLAGMLIVNYGQIRYKDDRSHKIR
jgi:hypothetical protein